MMSLDKQKALADGILSGLKVISPYAILAGGAPRDWYFSEEAKDLDFYLYSSAITVNAAKKQIASALGISADRVVHKAEHEVGVYQTMKCLRRIFDVYDYHMPVQIMQLQEPSDEFKVVDSMSTSICRVWYEGGEIHKTKDFLLTAKSGILFLDADYSWSDPHPTKIRERFVKRFCAGTKEQATNKLLYKALYGGE
jgi:hypothetical protein